MSSGCKAQLQWGPTHVISAAVANWSDCSEKLAEETQRDGGRGRGGGRQWRNVEDSKSIKTEVDRGNPGPYLPFCTTEANLIWGRRIPWGRCRQNTTWNIFLMPAMWLPSLGGCRLFRRNTGTRMGRKSEGSVCRRVDGDDEREAGGGRKKEKATAAPWQSGKLWNTLLCKNGVKKDWKWGMVMRLWNS